MCLSIGSDTVILFSSSVAIIGVGLWVLGNAIQTKWTTRKETIHG